MQRSLIIRLTALLMCFALVFMVSPIRAEAMTMSSFFLLFGDDILNLILAICKGLGVTWTTLELADRAVQGILDDMQSVDYLWTDGGIQVLQYIGADGTWKNGISLEMVEWVQQWLFGNGVVDSVSSGSGMMFYNGVKYPSLDNFETPISWSIYDYACILIATHSSGPSYPKLVTFSSPGILFDGVYFSSADGSSLKFAECNLSTNDKWECNLRSSGKYPISSVWTCKVIWTNFDLYSPSGELLMLATEPLSVGVVGSDDVELGQVVSPDVAIPDGYTQWSTGVATVGDSVYYPVTMGPTLEDTLSQTQEQVWTGSASFQIISVNCSFLSDSDDGDVYLGSVVQLMANVAGTGVYSSAVTWTWYADSGPLSSSTTLSADGVLTIGLDETATFVTAQAISVADPTKFGTVTIHLTLTEAPAIPTTPVDSLGNTDVGTFIGNITGSIVDGISSLFIPSAEVMAAQQVKWGDLVATRFGAMAQAGDLIDDVIDTFQLGEKQEYIEIPGVAVTFGDVPWTFGPFQVKVIPEGFEFVVVSIKLVTNIGCTLLFANALKRRYERIMEG